MTAEEYLSTLANIDQLIDMKISEQRRLFELATSISPNMDGMPHGSGVSDRVGNIVVKLVDLATEIDELIDCYVDRKQGIVKALEELPPNESGALYRHYIQHMTWEDVAEDMNYSVPQVYRFRRSGLEKLKMIVNDSE